MNEKKQIAIYINKKAYEDFQRLYPHTLSSYFRKCLYSAVQNKEFFQEVFFNVPDAYFGGK